MNTATRRGIIYIGVLIVGGIIGYVISQIQSGELERQIASLTSKIAEQKSQSETALSEAKKSGDSAVNASKAAAEKALTEQKSQADAVLAAVKTEASETTNQLQTDLEAKAQLLSEKEANIANLDTQVEDLESKITALTEVERTLTEQNNLADTALAKAAETANQLQTDLATKTNLLSEQEATNASLKTQVADLESKSLALSVAKANADAANSDLQGQVTSMEADAQAKVEGSAVDIARLSADLEQTKQSLAEETEKARQLESAVSILKQELELARNAIDN